MVPGVALVARQVDALDRRRLAGRC
jgi:hypothetical protein